MEKGAIRFAPFLRLATGENGVFIQLQRLNSPACAAFCAGPVE
jgi:hypothetical protein